MSNSFGHSYGYEDARIQVNKAMRSCISPMLTRDKIDEIVEILTDYCLRYTPTDLKDRPIIHGISIGSDQIRIQFPTDRIDDHNLSWIINWFKKNKYHVFYFMSPMMLTEYDDYGFLECTQPSILITLDIVKREK